MSTGQAGIIRTLLESKTVDPNVQDSMGQTALFRAVQVGDEGAVRVLLEAHPPLDVNMRDKVGDVALHLAVEKGSEGMIGLLLGAGADVDA